MQWVSSWRGQSPPPPKPRGGLQEESPSQAGSHEAGGPLTQQVWQVANRLTPLQLFQRKSAYRITRFIDLCVGACLRGRCCIVDSIKEIVVGGFKICAWTCDEDFSRFSIKLAYCSSNPL